MSLPQPIGQFRDGKRSVWVLTERYTLRLNGGDIITIAPGFSSDGVSLPWLLQPALGSRFAGDTLPGALVHDALYAAQITTRARADREFALLLVRGGVSAARVRAYYRGVRLFGGIAWRRNLREVERAREYVARVDVGAAQIIAAMRGADQ